LIDQAEELKMAKVTIAERLVYTLTQKGETEVPSKTRKYRVFTRTTPKQKDGQLIPQDKPTFYFVGKAGALRFGTCASMSCSIGSAVLRFLEKWPMPRK
jgi:hypothetical protein